jgi:diamine N-acetyltransferase
MHNSAPLVGPDAVVSLREITKETVGSILALQVAPEQQHFVASNAVSIAQAHFSPEAWFRAIYADETPVGFIMLSDRPDTSEYFLWRLMVRNPSPRRGEACRAKSEPDPTQPGDWLRYGRN